MMSQPKSKISQNLLANFSEMRKEEKRMREKVRQMREEILKLDDGGAKVESGPLSLELRTVERKILSQKSLTEVLGEEGAKELKEKIPPTTSRRLYVRDANSNSRIRKKPSHSKRGSP